MGLSGIVLKKKDNVDIQKIIHDIKLSAINSGLQFKMGKELKMNEDGTYNYLTINIANTFEENDNQQQMLLYVYNSSEDDYTDEFDWILNEGKLIQVINIEDFHDCEKILLDFLYEYICLNPEDIFWDELNWFYKYDDLIQIHNQSFDKEWCYKK